MSSTEIIRTFGLVCVAPVRPVAPVTEPAARAARNWRRLVISGKHMITESVKSDRNRTLVRDIVDPIYEATRCCRDRLCRSREWNYVRVGWQPRDLCR